eukprot:gene12810-14791_t
MIKGLIAATGYQFRICAENALGRSHWSLPSRLSQLEFGLPEQFETPQVCQVKQRSIMIGWFTCNPLTFGAASQTLQVQVSGGGKSYEENHLLEISLEEGVQRGKIMLRSFKKLHDTYLQKKDALMKSQGFNIHHSKTGLTDQEHEEGQAVDLPDIAENFSISDIENLLHRRSDTTMLFVVAEYTHLIPGFSYLFRTRGVNVAGLGPWSVPTYSTFTKATIPGVPHRPRIAQAALRSILFAWDPPDTGGSAITGYNIYLKNTDKHISLPRSAVTYLWEGLFPGRSYFLQVQAKNEIGASEYSEFNLPNQSHTLTGPPEVPLNPHAVSGTWDKITLQTRLPYNNGALITRMQIEQRFIDPFQIGDWEHTVPTPDSVRNIPDQVEVIESVDYEQQAIDIENMVRELETVKNSAGFNPYSKDNEKIDKEIQLLIEKQKPPGSLIRFTVENLAQNRLNEFRVCFVNDAGKSEWSQPSHRAKTNKAQLPAKCATPTIHSMGPDSITLHLLVPAEGGAPIRLFCLEVMDLDANETRVIKHTRNAQDAGESLMARIPSLKPGGAFIFRARAESDVGNGEFSEWTEEVKLLIVEHNARDTAAAVIAKKRK